MTKTPIMVSFVNLAPYLKFWECGVMFGIVLDGDHFEILSIDFSTISTIHENKLYLFIERNELKCYSLYYRKLRFPTCTL